MKKSYMIFILILLFSNLFGYYFGENKIQTKKVKWEVLKTLHFDIYYDKVDPDFGKTAALIAEDAYYYLRQDFTYPLKKRVPIIFYNTQHTFNNTNIISPILNNSVGGFTEVSKNRVVIPFKGDYKEMESVLIHELTHAYINDIDGNNFSILSTGRIPFWFSEGLPEFESKQGKKLYNNMFVADLLINGKLYDLENVGGYYAYREGESFLSFIADKYGRKTIMKFYYAIKLSTNIDAASKKIFGMEFNEIQEYWHNYLKNRYFPMYKDYNAPMVSYERKTNHQKDGSYVNFAPRFAPDGTQYLYFSNKSLRTSIYKASVYNLFKEKKLLEGEKNGKLEDFHLFRYNLSWFPDGKRFAFAAESTSGDKIYIVNGKKSKIIKTINPGDFDAIFELDVSHDGKKIIFSAQKIHNTDIFVYDINSEKVTRITNDRFNDKQPRFSPDDSKVAFVSDRYLNKKEPHNFYSLTDNIFYYDFSDSLFYQVTFDKYNNEFPFWTSDSKHIIFASRENVASNYNIIDLENGKKAVVSKIFSGVSNGDIDSQDESLIFSCLYNGGWDIYIMHNPLDSLDYVDYKKPIKTNFKDDFYSFFNLDRVNYYGYKKRKFKREFPDYSSDYVTKFNFGHALERDSLNKKYNHDIDEKPTKLNPPKTKKYRAKFSIDQIWGGMAYSPTNGAYAQIMMRMSDIMGNHTIGINIGIDRYLKNTDLVLDYLYLAKRLDYGLGIFHVSNDYVYQIIYSNTNKVDYFRERVGQSGFYFTIRYPMNKFWRIDLENIVQQVNINYDWWDWNDDTWTENFLTPEIMDTLNLESTKIKTIYATPQLTLVHDNSLYGNVGPIKGWKMALMGNLNLASNSHPYSETYFDFRSYLFFAKKFTFALKFNAGAMFGDYPYPFVLDGSSDVRGYVEDSDVGQSLQGKYKATTSFEFRFPFIDNLRTSFPLPLMFYNIRGSAFLDIGSIWDNKLTVLENDRLQDVKMGFGFGPRVNLGYFILKFDTAWQSDTHSISSPRYYIGLSEDF